MSILEDRLKKDKRGYSPGKIVRCLMLHTTWFWQANNAIPPSEVPIALLRC